MSVMEQLQLDLGLEPVALDDLGNERAWAVRSKQTGKKMGVLRPAESGFLGHLFVASAALPVRGESVGSVLDEMLRLARLIAGEPECLGCGGDGYVGDDPLGESIDQQVCVGCAGVGTEAEVV